MMSIDYTKQEVFNPAERPEDELPRIFGFNNGGSPGWYDACALAADGTYLGGHICSAEGFVPLDLGCFKGSRPDRHEKDYRRHYPNGYVMEYVERDSIKKHEGLKEAIRLNKLKAAENEKHTAGETA